MQKTRPANYGETYNHYKNWWANLPEEEKKKHRSYLFSRGINNDEDVIKYYTDPTPYENAYKAE